MPEAAIVNMADRKRFFITTSWDDGTVHDLKLAELLSRYQLPATFYVAKNHPYGGLQEREICSLAQSFELGAHTLNHVVLDSVPDKLAESEIRNSKSWIEQLSGHECKVFCFPRGRFANRHARMVKNAGFSGTRSVELMSHKSASMVSGVAIMPTTIQTFPHKTSSYLKNIFGRRRLSNLVTYLRAERKDWMTMANSLLSGASSHGGVFHLWGHAWEIEELKLWQDVERLFQALEHHKSHAAFVCNGDLCTGVVS
jgi:peptidoglycan-N-acetylglucosamine deacetylase